LITYGSNLKTQEITAPCANSTIQHYMTADLASFFEREYKNSQNELLQAKSQLYEQRFKIECLKKKLQEKDDNYNNQL
jgi:hypothetical protein